MHRRILIKPYPLLLIVFTLLFSSQPSAGSASCSTHGQQRPSIGLALSGGGARGAAHVGVLKKLEELRIPIDCIAGTSMGSVIGGLYASGMSVDDLEDAIADIDWAGVFKDAPERANRTMRRKSDDLLFLMKKKVRIKDGGVSAGGSLIQGQKFDLVLSELTLSVHDVDDFNELMIPFRAVATDITTGQQVVLGSGSLARALRASMAVPAAFAAIKMDGMLLVDGGIANNLPISVVREMGADLVIAVDISTPLRSRDELDTALTVLDQLGGLLTQRNVAEQLATLTDRDLYIQPELGEIGSGDFGLVNEAISAGGIAAEALRDKLRLYALSGREFENHLAARQPAGGEKTVPVVDFVRIVNDSRVGDATIAGHLNYPQGKPLDFDALDTAIGRVYGMGVFESVRYRVIEEEGKTGIVIDARETSWGTNSIQGGIELSSDLEGASYFNIGAAYTVVPLNQLNGEWRTIGYLGEEPSLITEIYQPLDPAERWFFHAGLYYQNDSTKLFQDHHTIAEYDIDRHGLQLGGGYNLGTFGRIELSWHRFTGDAEVATGTSVPDFDFDNGELHFTGAYDTLDSIYFPRKGLIGSFTWIASRDAFGADDEFDQYLFHIGGAKSWADHTLIASINYQTTADDDAPIQNQFSLGGFLNLSGLQQNELSGQHSARLLGGYMYRMTNKFIPTYVGVSLEMGNVWQSSNNISLSDSIMAGSVFIGADTFLGPLYLGLGHAEGGNNAVYLFLGQPWFSR